MATDVFSIFQATHLHFLLHLPCGVKNKNYIHSYQQNAYIFQEKSDRILGYLYPRGMSLVVISLVLYYNKLSERYLLWNLQKLLKSK